MPLDESCILVSFLLRTWTCESLNDVLSMYSVMILVVFLFAVYVEDVYVKWTIIVLGLTIVLGKTIRNILYYLQ